MRHGARLGLLVISILVGTCGGDGGGLTPGDPRDGPPDAPGLACPQDPDCFTNDTCNWGCPDYWHCTEGEAPEGGKRCWNPDPFPDDGAWTCIDVSGVTECRGDHMPDDGEGWTCVEEGGEVVCTQDANYPDGGATGGWDCYVAGEFRVCDEEGGGEGEGEEGEGEGPDEEFPDDGAEGTYDCWTSEAGDVVECDTPDGDSPDGGDDLCWVVDPGAGSEETSVLGEGTVVYGNYEIGELDGVDAVYVRFAFTERFVDNTYGANTAEDWPRGHSFNDLVESDKAAITMTDANGDVVLQFTLDYVSVSPDAPSGYACLGVLGGEGSMEVGDPSAVLRAVTSIDRNLNQRGCVFLDDSPTPDQCPEWDNQVVYEVFVRLDAFGAAGVGGPAIGEVHASPSKLGPGNNSAEVEPGECI